LHYNTARRIDSANFKRGGNVALVINERVVEGILILDLQGRVIAGESAGHLRERANHAAASENRNIILNMKGVDYIDSSGLGTLVAAHSTLSKAGGALALMNLSKRAAELLILTKLATVFRIFDDEKAAVDSFFPNRKVQHFDILDFVKNSGKE
jgi:anti-sigma B factor antagonist